MSERPYRSPLREESARRTRELILDTLVELAGAGGMADLNIADLADRAGVSPRTVYRHFPDRAALLSGLSDHLEARGTWTVGPDQITSIDELHDAAPRSYQQFEDHLTETRALVALNLAGSAPLSRDHREAINRLAREWFPRLEPDDAAAVGAVLHLLMSSRTWIRLRDEDGLDAERAARALGWAIRTLTADLAGRSELDERRDAQRAVSGRGRGRTDHPAPGR